MGERSSGIDNGETRVPGRQAFSIKLFVCSVLVVLILGPERERSIQDERHLIWYAAPRMRQRELAECRPNENSLRPLTHSAFAKVLYSPTPRSPPISRVTYQDELTGFFLPCAVGKRPLRIHCSGFPHRRHFFDWCRAFRDPNLARARVCVWLPSQLKNW